MTPVGEKGTWESQNAYNPAVIYRNGKFWMLYRGENSDLTLRPENSKLNQEKKVYRSQIGLAWSTDGIKWMRYEKNPVLRAELGYELPGGLEDPRLIEYNGTYYCYYTAYNPGGQGVRLCVASSTDLKSWKKFGPIFPEALKNGAILMDPDNKPVKLNGKFVMYSSVGDMYFGQSDDLIHWDFKLMKVPFPQTYYPLEFCIALTNYEKSNNNILIFIGGRLNGGPKAERWHYALGQCLAKKSEPSKIVELMDEPFMIPTEPYEQKGFINYTLFFESLTRHNGEWWLYYGAADHQIGLAKMKSW